MRKMTFYEFNWAHIVPLNNHKFKLLAGYAEILFWAHDVLQVCLNFEHFSLSILISTFPKKAAFWKSHRSIALEQILVRCRGGMTIYKLLSKLEFDSCSCKQTHASRKRKIEEELQLDKGNNFHNKFQHFFRTICLMILILLAVPNINQSEICYILCQSF